MSKNTHYNKLFFRLFVIGLGILLGISALTVRSVIDARDLEKVIKANTPKILSSDPRFTKIYEEVIDRPVYLEPDAYYWITYTTDLVKNNQVRFRLNMYDNVPYGSKISWNSGYAWWLGLLGKIHSTFTQEDIIKSIEEAGRWANPIIYGLFGIFWSIVLGIRFSPLIGSCFTIIYFFTGAIWSDSVFGRGDHHVLHINLVLSQLLSILVAGAGIVQKNLTSKTKSLTGSFEPTDYKTARIWFVIASLLGAAGLWVGANQQSLVIGFIGVGGGITALLFSGSKNTSSDQSKLFFSNDLWRLWGRSGAFLSIAFYLIEYFPDQLGMRLELNHPLYALAWLSGGELIYRIRRLKTGRSITDKENTSNLLVISLSIAGILALPAVVLIGNPSWHILNNPILMRAHEYIYEYRSLFSMQEQISAKDIFFRFGLYPLSLIPALLALSNRFFSPFQRFLILQAAIPALGLTCLYAYQVRWENILATAFTVLYLTILLILCANVGRRKNTSIFQTVFTLFFLLLFVPQCLATIKLNYFQKNFLAGFQNRFPTFGFILVAREVAINLHLLNTTDELRIIGDNSMAPMLAYYGVAKSVGSLYWPNGDGIADNAKFLSASSESEALEVIERRGVTHVLLQADDSKRAEIALWTYKGTRDFDELKKTFAYKMAYNPSSHPAWLVPYKPFYNRFSKQDKTVYYEIDLPPTSK